MKTWIFAVMLLALSGCARVEKPPIAAPAPQPKPVEKRMLKLVLDDYWRLNLPEGRRFDASGLVFAGADLLVVGDAMQEPFRVRFSNDHTANLERTEMFTPGQTREFFTGRRARVDFEGLARDDAGRIYVCEEAERLILRFDPVTRKVERLPIDWTPVRKYFTGATGNAGFEGIAAGGGRIWAANERESPRIIEVDAKTLQITGDFAPEASFWGLVLHYSDLCWFEGNLYVLLRHHRVVLQIDPASRAVLAEYDYRAIEEDPEHEYRRDLPTGVMEGLSVDREHFWLLTDNNGHSRKKTPGDSRPTLFRCRRPPPFSDQPFPAR